VAAGQHSPIAFDHLTAEDGLSHSTVYALLEDEGGLIWIGTRYGLNRFDGYECKVFLPEKSGNGSIFGPSVYALLEDSQGKIWVGHREAGISVLDKQTGRFERFPQKPTSPNIEWDKATVRTIFEDSRGWVWVGTSGNGAFVFDENKRQIGHYSEDSKPKSAALSGDFIFDILEDAKGTIWIATDGKGINGYDPATKAIFQLDSGEPLNMLSYEKSLCLDHVGNLWIGTSGSGLYRYDLARKQFTHYYSAGNAQNKLSNNLIRDVEADPLGQIWIATDGGGLNIFDTSQDQWRVVTTSANFPQALNSNAIYQLMFDRIGNLWVGTFNGGVNIHKAYNPPFFIHEKQQEYHRLGLRSVLAIEQDNDGKIWLGCDGGGLFVAKPHGKNLLVEKLALAIGPLPKVVTCLEKAKDGGLWVGSYAGGLHFFDEKTGRSKHFMSNEQDPTSLSHNNVWDIAADQQGGLWVGTLGNGLNYLPPNSTKFKRYLPAADHNSLSSVQIVDVLLDKNGKYLWAASEDKGLNRLDIAKGTITRFQSAGKNAAFQLSSDNLHCLYQDSKGRIWVGTEFSGLDCVEKEGAEILHYNTDHGLPSNMIISIVEDGNGLLWIATQRGIVRFDPEKKTFSDFGTDVNLNNNHYNPRAATRLSDGRMVFGGTDGFSILLPNSIQKNPHAPKVIFTDLKLAGHSVSIGDWNGRIVLSGHLNHPKTMVELAASDRGIIFEFTANDFTNPGKNRFAYFLEGFDKDWNHVGADQHRAVFSNLAGGSYTLRVKAANSDGVWGEETVLRIKVQPPFWKTWWFAMAMLSLVGAIVYFTFKYILDHQKAAFQAAQFKAEQEIMRLKNETLQKEVEDNQGKLSASVLETAHKNQFLFDLKAQIQKIESSLPEMRKVVRSIDSELNQEDYWEQFQLTFNQMHQDFVHLLHERHPDITNNDLRLCCFIRMGMSNAEIATILNITVNGVEQSKYRLKRKMGLEKDASLNDYIRTI
jgi:ligand-binding sensor domain-containing protein/DNA-binding CsgD family transcriptional regulator